MCKEVCFCISVQERYRLYHTFNFLARRKTFLRNKVFLLRRDLKSSIAALLSFAMKGDAWFDDGRRRLSDVHHFSFISARSRAMNQRRKKSIEDQNCFFDRRNRKPSDAGGGTDVAHRRLLHNKHHHRQAKQLTEHMSNSSQGW